MQEFVQYWIDKLLLESPFAALLQIEPVSVVPDKVHIQLPAHEGITCIGNYIPGGAIAALIELAGNAAAVSGITGRAAGCATSHLNTTYIALADEKTLDVIAIVTHRTKHQAIVDVVVSGINGRTVGKATVICRIFDIGVTASPECPNRTAFQPVKLHVVN